MLTDPIADFITRIRNAYLAKHKHLLAPYSKINQQIAQIMVEQGYLSDVKQEAGAPHPQLFIKLKYDNKQPVLRHIRRISKPGRRVYSPAKKLRVPLNGLGLGIISTSQGLMSIKQAKQKGLGGEIICEMW